MTRSPAWRSQLSCSLRKVVVLLAVMAPASILPKTVAQAASSVTVAVTNDFVSRSPYGDSTAQMFGIWCQIYGCLVNYVQETGELKGLLAESWAIEPGDPSAWIVTLRKGLKRHKDGRELKAEDVIHSIKTRGPSAVLPIETFDQLIITSKDLYDKHGAEKADRDFPLGWGPYELRQNQIGQRMVLEKFKDWPGIKATNPDRLIFVRIPEPEAQLTGLHNGEIQISTLIPPHMIDRLKSTPGFQPVSVPSAEGFFLGMNSKYPPWNNKAARLAVAYAVNKQLIVDTIYRGQAIVLDAIVGEGQFGWSKDLKPLYSYDPKKAHAILEEAGLLGTESNFTVTTNRFLYDVQAASAIVPMLEAAGFKVNFQTIEYATQFAEVQRGNRPFYLHSRGNLMDPTAALVQMFETGVTNRIRYANPEFDKVLAQSRTEFDRAKRSQMLQKSINILEADEPAVWLWKAHNIYGMNVDKISFKPTAHNRVSGTEITVKP